MRRLRTFDSVLAFPTPLFPTGDATVLSAFPLTVVVVLAAFVAGKPLLPEVPVPVGFDCAELDEFVDEVDGVGLRDSVEEDDDDGATHPLLLLLLLLASFPLSPRRNNFSKRWQSCVT